jgi:hypothetical protein
VKKPSTHVLILVVFCALALMLVAASVYHPSRVVGALMDAAFRDGLFLGRLDAEQGRKPQLSAGRWSTDSDRRLFVSGYVQAYGEMFRAAEDEPHAWQLAEQRGYRDGITDGVKQRRGSKRFQASASENYARADRGFSSRMGELTQHKQLYREAYCTDISGGTIATRRK